MPAEHKLIVRDGDRVREVLLVGTVTVGRSPTVRGQLGPIRGCRATHAAFEVVGGDVFVRDLGSRNGTTVNGAAITRQRLDAADTVEIGPFVIQLVEDRTAQAEPVAPPLGNDDRTVLLPPRAARAAGAPPAAPPAPSAPAEIETGRPAVSPIPGAASADPAPPDGETDDEATRRITRSEARRRAAPLGGRGPSAPGPRVRQPRRRLPTDAEPVDEATRRITRSEVIRRTAPGPVPPAPPPPRPAPAPTPAVPTTAPRPPVAATPPPVAASSPVAPAPEAASAAPAPTAVPRATAAELTFPRVALLWVVPVALVSFIAGLVPSLLEPEQRAPLLRAHYAALAATAEELVRRSGEPAPPLDGVTTALRGYTGVTGARVLGADGRVLAPMNEAGTRLDVAPIEGRGPRITTAASGIVDVHTPAATADGRAVIVALTVDPAVIHPPPAGSPTGAVMVLLSLAAAWLAARQLTQITDGRLSRLGEEVELMATRQVSAGHDPFGLRGGQRIVDAATFAVSLAARRPEGDDAPGERRRRENAGTGHRLAGTGPNVGRADRRCHLSDRQRRRRRGELDRRQPGNGAGPAPHRRPERPGGRRRGASVGGRGHGRAANRGRGAGRRPRIRPGDRGDAGQRAGAVDHPLHEAVTGR